QPKTQRAGHQGVAYAVARSVSPEAKRRRHLGALRRVSGRALGRDLVADAPHGHDRRRVPELSPDLPDVDVHRPRVAGEGVAPHALEQLVSSEDDAAMVEQLPEEVELLRRELDLVVADEHLAATGVDRQVAVADLVTLIDAAVGRRAAEDALHAGDELARVEGLREVVVRTDLEADDLVDVLVARGQHDDRHVRALPDPAADLDPVHVRQVEVEHDEGRHLGRDGVERTGAGAHRAHAVAGVLEIERDERRDRLLVLDDQHRLRLAHGATAFVVGPSTAAAPNATVWATLGIADEPASPIAYVPVAPVGSGLPVSVTLPCPRAEMENPSPRTVILYRPPGT